MWSCKRYFFVPILFTTGWIFYSFWYGSLNRFLKEILKKEDIRIIFLTTCQQKIQKNSNQANKIQSIWLRGSALSPFFGNSISIVIWRFLLLHFIMCRWDQDQLLIPVSISWNKFLVHTVHIENMNTLKKLKLPDIDICQYAMIFLFLDIQVFSITFVSWIVPF